MKPRKGESPAEFLIRATLAAGEDGEKAANDHPERLFQPRWTSEEAVAALSDVFGEPPQVVTQWLAMVHEADAHHQIRARLAKSDELAASKRGPPAPPTRAARDAESRRAAIEAAARKVEGAEEDRPVAHSATEALMDYAEGREPAMSSSAKQDVERIRTRRHQEAERHKRSVSGRVEQPAAYLDRRQPAAPESSPTSDASPSGGMSIRDAMEAAESRLTSNGGNADE